VIAGMGSHRPLQGLRILVVDDDPDQLVILSGLLGHAGAHVEVARTAQEAFDTFQSDAADVVVSDIAMPQTTGYNLVRRIRASPRGRTVPVVAITAFFEDEHFDKAMAAGFNAWLAKPASDTVVGVIARLTGRR
jgi:CheY-like chemotaxis protein